jgi:hypothetical protein
MNFELFDAAFKHREGLGLNSKFKIENSKLRSLKTAMQQSEPPKTMNAMPSPETV